MDMSETEILKEISGAMDKFSTGFLDYAKRSDEKFSTFEQTLKGTQDVQSKMLERLERMGKDDHKDNGKGKDDDNDTKVEEAERMMKEAKRMKEEADKKMQDAEAMAKKYKQSEPEPAPEPTPEPEAQSDVDIDALLADIDRSLSTSESGDPTVEPVAESDDDIDKLLSEIDQSDPIPIGDMWGEQNPIEDVHRFDNPVINDALEAIRANPEGGLDKIWQNVDAGNYFPRVQPTSMEILKRSVPGVFRTERT